MHQGLDCNNHSNKNHENVRAASTNQLTAAATYSKDHYSTQGWQGFHTWGMRLGSELSAGWRGGVCGCSWGGARPDWRPQPEALNPNPHAGMFLSNPKQSEGRCGASRLGDLVTEAGSIVALSSSKPFDRCQWPGSPKRRLPCFLHHASGFLCGLTTPVDRGRCPCARCLTCPKLGWII